MTGRTTKPYKNTLSGSVGAGMGSLFNPSGRKYYILEHKVSSKYHKAGEAQEIIIDNIELGRDSHCQVRFDEKFQTVSRHHARIVKDGDMWKLVQLSKTNSTFLNGRPINTEWYLQSGDEIQLSVNGPKLGFIIPTGNKSTVGSIGLTRRLSLFRQQALRPYKTALSVLSSVLILAVVGLGSWNYFQGEEFDRQMAEAQELIKKSEEKLALLRQKNTELEKKIGDAAVEQARLDSLLKEKSRPIHKTVVVRQGDGEGSAPTSALQEYENDIFYMSAILCASYKGQLVPLETSDGGYLGWTATGYLLNDGRFITAKHCVEGWKFDSAESIGQQYSSLKDETTQTLFVAGLSEAEGVSLVAVIIARSPSKELKFQSTQFTCTRRDEDKVNLGDGMSITCASGEGGCDWAYINVGQSGSIPADASLSANLPAGVRLEVLGYPQGHKSESGSCLYGSCQTSGRGLNEGLILITGKNYEHGNSGGPVFYNDNGTYKAVGIVSFSVYDNMGGITPLYNLK